MYFQQKLHNLRLALGYTQKEMGLKLGLNPTYISALENGAKQPSESVMNHVALLEQARNAGLLCDGDHHPIPSSGILPAPRLVDEGKGYQFRNQRVIPVIGMAHAGEPGIYEEIGKDWADWVPTDCRDAQAYGARIEGDSMINSDPGISFDERDIVIAQPSVEPTSGCFILGRFTNEGTTFRRYEKFGDVIRLIPLNHRYQVTEHSRSEFKWIHPIYTRVTLLWNR